MPGPAEPLSARRRRRVAAYVHQITSAVERDLEHRLLELAREGHSLDEIGPAGDLAERMLAAVPRPSPWNRLAGPFYRTPQVAELLGGISRQAVADRCRRGTLLGLKTADGALVYPAFQFGDDNRVLSGFAELLQPLAASGVDGWTVAGWLAGPSRALDGRSPVEWLAQGRKRERVVALARDAARRFAA